MATCSPAPDPNRTEIVPRCSYSLDFATFKGSRDLLRLSDKLGYEDNIKYKDDIIYDDDLYYEDKVKSEDDL